MTTFTKEYKAFFAPEGGAEGESRACRGSAIGGSDGAATDNSADSFGGAATDSVCAVTDSRSGNAAKNAQAASFKPRGIWDNPHGRPGFAFTPVTDDNAALLREFAKKTPYLHSSCSVGQILMWKSVFRPAYAVVNGCVVFRFFEGETPVCSFPFGVEAGADAREALKSLASYAEKECEMLSFFAVPEEKLHEFCDVFPAFSVKRDRRESDYLYEREALAAFSGKKYAGQRNHIRRFLSVHPGAVFRPYRESDRAAVQVFFDRLEKEQSPMEGEKALEFRLAKDWFFSDLCGDLRFIAEDGGEVLGISSGECYGETAAVHIEKGLSEAEGVYPFLCQGFAKSVSVRYVNREDDAGARGLRISKLQYEPEQIVDAVRVTVSTGAEGAADVLAKSAWRGADFGAVMPCATAEAKSKSKNDGADFAGRQVCENLNSGVRKPCNGANSGDRLSEIGTNDVENAGEKSSAAGGEKSADANASAAGGEQPKNRDITFAAMPFSGNAKYILSGNTADLACGKAEIRLLQSSDAAALDLLSTDDEINRLFGYDYREDDPSPAPGAFYRKAKAALFSGTELRFALLLNGEFAGEAALDSFDFFGGCNLSFRLFPAFRGKGLASFAAAKLVDLALYGLGLKSVSAYSFKENEGSVKVLSKRLKKVGEDERYVFFRAEI